VSYKSDHNRLWCCIQTLTTPSISLDISSLESVVITYDSIHRTLVTYEIYPSSPPGSCPPIASALVGGGHPDHTRLWYQMSPEPSSPAPMKTWNRSRTEMNTLKFLCWQVHIAFLCIDSYLKPANTTEQKKLERVAELFSCRPIFWPSPCATGPGKPDTHTHDGGLNGLTTCPLNKTCPGGYDRPSQARI
jgi:hypothetical protein